MKSLQSLKISGILTFTKGLPYQSASGPTTWAKFCHFDFFRERQRLVTDKRLAKWVSRLPLESYYLRKLFYFLYVALYLVNLAGTITHFSISGQKPGHLTHLCE